MFTINSRVLFISLCLFAALTTVGCSQSFLSTIQTTSPSSNKQSTNIQVNSETTNFTQAVQSSPTIAQTPSTPTATASESIQSTPQKEDLVVYNGPVEHIFFHPLIAYKERAFDNDSMTQGYNDWFVTVSEFQKTLQSLYDKQFILVNFPSFLEQKTINGHTLLERKELKLPKGKKPLLLSIDDINYYDYMIENGNVFRLVLDTDGNIATYSKNSKGEPIISHDNEIVPILDGFVQQHPDFSYQGAKGILSVTGYQGVLGYRTNYPKSPTYEQDKHDAVQVITRLKETGWTFACHGYGHLDANQITETRLIQDTNRWKQEVEPLVGPTPIYIYPFGSRVPTGSAKFQSLLKAGFDILCSVGPTSYSEFTPQYFMMDRRHIDGISLHSQRSYLLDLFDSNKVIDADRPAKY